MVGSKLKIRDQEGMVGRFRLESGFEVDEALGARFGEGGAGEDIIDPPSLAEGGGMGGAIIEEGIVAGFGVVAAKDIHEPPVPAVGEGVAGVLVVAHVPRSLLGVENIDGLGCDIHVPQPYHRIGRAETGIKGCTQPPEPFALVSKHLVVDFPALGDVGIDEGDRSDSGLQKPRFVGGTSILESGAHLGGRFPRQDGHPIVGLLPAEYGVVAGLFQCLGGEQLIHHLGFLDTQYIRLVDSDPAEQAVQPTADGVGIKGDDAHR